MSQDDGKPVVLLTDPIDGAAAISLAAYAKVVPLSDAELADAMREAAVVIVRRWIPPQAIAGALRLRALVRHGVGLDFIPVDAASELGIAVTNTPGANATSVAEATIGLMLAGARRIALKDRHIRQGGWTALRDGAFEETEITGKSLGLVGFGAIGKAIARIASLGFGMRVLATRRRPAAEDSPPGVLFTSLENVLAEADVLVLACPLTEETRGLIGAREIARMRPGSAIVNIARGAIIDEFALFAALDAGHLAYAGLDVLAIQPPPARSPLLHCDRVVLTPHTAGISTEAVARMSSIAADDVARILAFKRPRHLVNADAWATIDQRWQSLSG